MFTLFARVADLEGGRHRLVSWILQHVSHANVKSSPIVSDLSSPPKFGPARSAVGTKSPKTGVTSLTAYHSVALTCDNLIVPLLRSRRANAAVWKKTLPKATNHQILRVPV